MTLSRRLSLLSVVLASVAMALGYLLRGLGLWALPTLGLGLVWMVAKARGWRRMPAVGLIMSAALAAAGLLQSVGPEWMLAGLVAAITAWDLDHFVQAMQAADRVDQPGELERRHLQRLAMVDLLGLALGLVTFHLEARLDFLVIVLLSLLVAWGMSHAVSFLRRESS